MYEHPHALRHNGHTTAFLRTRGTPYYDTACVPLGTIQVTDLLKNQKEWRRYYCKYRPPNPIQHAACPFPPKFSLLLESPRVLESQLTIVYRKIRLTSNMSLLLVARLHLHIHLVRLSTEHRCFPWSRNHRRPLLPVRLRERELGPQMRLHRLRRPGPAICCTANRWNWIYSRPSQEHDD
jgi:hypothetical protein